MALPPDVHADIAILGGGVLGLWTRALLAEAGYSVLLLERSALGAAQTGASQGILHRGVKYALAGALSGASREVAGIAEAWDRSLRAETTPDLSAVRVLSETTTLWTTRAKGARLVARAAAGAMASGVRRLPVAGHPAFLRGAPSGTDAFEVNEPVLDPGDLVGALSAQPGGPIVCCAGWRQEWGRAGDHATLRLSPEPGTEGETIRVHARRFVLGAGAGNDAPLRALGHDPGALMQLRPLHMVLVDDAPATVFGHCLTRATVPRLTITTSVHNKSRRWYIGGAVAEEGVGRSPGEQIEAARVELGECLGWLNLDDTRWSTLRVDRAEGLDAGGRRPDTPVVVPLDPGIIAAWPTKLVLAPGAARSILALVREAIPDPEGGPVGPIDLPRPAIADPMREGDQPWS